MEKIMPTDLNVQSVRTQITLRLIKYTGEKAPDKALTDGDAQDISDAESPLSRAIGIAVSIATSHIERKVSPRVVGFEITSRQVLTVDGKPYSGEAETIHPRSFLGSARPATTKELANCSGLKGIPNRVDLIGGGTILSELDYRVYDPVSRNLVHNEAQAHAYQ